MAYPIETREEVIKLRRKGYSLNELHDKFGVAKGRLSDWLRDVSLPPRAIKRLDHIVRKGRVKAAETNKSRTRRTIERFTSDAMLQLEGLVLDKEYIRLMCALIYYCEGRKSMYDHLSFTNSDPNLIRTFLKLFRAGFNVNENKLHVCVHLHQYHNPTTTLRFWSRLTGIPLRQFMRPYQKPNTGKRIRNGYNGCAAVSYYDVNMAREVLTLAEAFLKQSGP